MSAPERFAAWLSTYRKVDKWGHTYAYHPRSDAHSIELCRLVLEDIIEQCPLIREQASRGQVAWGTNVEFTWPNGKKKAIDLALGRPDGTTPTASKKSKKPKTVPFSEVYLSCEAKAIMTEHGKSEPRVFDELSSSHEIVHKGRADAIAAGIAVVNISPTFVSPTRNQRKGDDLEVTKHRQPDVARNMIQHLRGLAIREEVGEVGFDAYCTIVIDCDNQTRAELYTRAPAPQPGDADHYDTFLDRLVRFYSERFSRLP